MSAELATVAWESGTCVLFFMLRQRNYAKKNGISVFLRETSDLSEERLIG